MKRFMLAAATIFLLIQGCAGILAPKATLVAEYTKEEAKTAIESFIPAGAASNTSYGVRIFRMEYASLYEHAPGAASLPDISQTLDLTGLLIVPVGLPVEQEMLGAIFFHGTGTKSNEVPSNSFGCNRGVSHPCHPEYSLLASVGALAAAAQGSVGLAPDGIGYGDSLTSEPYPYLIEDAYGISGFSLLAAAKLFVSSNMSMTMRTSVVSSGYSEGGYGALALHRLSESNKFETEFSVSKSIPAGGPYDLAGSQMCSIIQENSIFNTIFPAYYALVGLAYDDFYNMSVLNGTLDSTMRNTILNGTLDVLSAGQLTQIAGGGVAVRVIEDSSTTNIRNYCSDNLTSVDEFLDQLQNNTLTSGWTPPADSIDLCHFQSDKIVPKSHFDALTSNFPDAIASSLLVTSGCSTHITCAVACAPFMFESLITQFNSMSTSTTSTTSTTSSSGTKTSTTTSSSETSSSTISSSTTSSSFTISSTSTSTSSISTTTNSQTTTTKTTVTDTSASSITSTRTVTQTNNDTNSDSGKAESEDEFWSSPLRIILVALGGVVLLLIIIIIVRSSRTQETYKDSGGNNSAGGTPWSPSQRGEAHPSLSIIRDNPLFKNQSSSTPVTKEEDEDFGLPTSYSAVNEFDIMTQ
eukprot:m.41356 g.41356  ORF g.41356 m.41356 type:complete len:636 (-) comp9757_c0_seq2:9-1916(-)